MSHKPHTSPVTPLSHYFFCQLASNAWFCRLYQPSVKTWITCQQWRGRDAARSTNCSAVRGFHSRATQPTLPHHPYLPCYMHLSSKCTSFVTARVNLFTENITIWGKLGVDVKWKCETKIKSWQEPLWRWHTHWFMPVLNLFSHESLKITLSSKTIFLG